VSAPAKTITFEEYLELEKTSSIRHEYVDGELHAMAGEKIRHNRIAGQLYALLLARAIERGCQIVIESVKLRVHNTRVRYPDVVVSCAPGDDDYFLENPCFIAEVLSDSTATTDLETKLEEYLRLPTLQRYAIISQDVRRVIVYKRVEGRWELEILNDGAFDVPCLETNVMLEQIYAGIEITG
jgi:Uma2 family endonuclease